MTKSFKVYITDTDGSERCGATLVAKSVAHARAIAKRLGVKNISSVEQELVKDGK